MQRVVSALGPSASSPSRAALRLVGRSDEPPASPATVEAPDDLPGREREKRLVDQARDAHFALCRRFRELAVDVAGTGLEVLYDRARRVDEELAALYQARAAILAHRLGRMTGSDAERRSVATTPAAAHEAPAAEHAAAGVPRTTIELSIEERALITRLRAASDHDRRALLHLAVRFTEAGRPTTR